MNKYIEEFVIDGKTGEVKQDCQRHTQLNREKIDADEALDGYYLIVTSETTSKCLGDPQSIPCPLAH